ncbi:PAS domain S-box protein [Phototrophicus methaneseepsis]|uniref:PAS domain S-box protein n=1 Tax=Phototrophicus methaneseepsis TaxID=2710758 RepID=A0A7S8ECY8_9CHLR|nr:PAS domain S-box protein [Phototrophicus methaneseepsis]QPC84692.1 PAS domain S-box protein [Phototrophicus methaneseepsis]
MKDKTIHQQAYIYEKLATTNKALESISDAIIIADHDGVAIYVNPAFLRSFGYTVAELNVGGIPNVLFQAPDVGKHIFDFMRSKGTWKGEVELATKQGEIVPYLLNVDSIKNDQDEPIGFITICTDITSHKRVSTIQQAQHTLVQAHLNTAKALTSTLDLAEVFKRILDNISHVVISDLSNIILIHDDRLPSFDQHENGQQAQKIAENAFIIDEADVSYYDDLRYILETNAPLVVPNTQAYLQQHSPMTLYRPWLNSHIGMAIRLQDEIIGFLNIDSLQPDLFTRDHADRLQLFAEQAAIAIHNARLHVHAQKLVMLEERQRLARYLHDAVSQTLFSASLIAEALPKLWQTKPDEVFPRLEQIRNLNRGALAKMRTLLVELHPERLLEAELSTLFHQLADGVLGQRDIEVQIDVAPELKLPPDIHVAVYYITQEALNNIVKHSGASLAAVQLNAEESLTLKIRDNGSGFDTQQIAPTSLGLDNIKERARATQAKLTIQSEIGKGTEIIVNWHI